MKMEIDPKAKATIILVILLVVGLVLGSIIAATTFSKFEKKIEERLGRRAVGTIRQIYVFTSVINMINISLLSGLLAVYINSFLKTSSNFLLGLSIFIGVLLIQSILSLPVLHAIFAATLGFSLIEVLQNIFESIALIILFYLSME